MKRRKGRGKLRGKVRCRIKDNEGRRIRREEKMK